MDHHFQAEETLSWGNYSLFIKMCIHEDYLGILHFLRLTAFVRKAIHLFYTHPAVLIGLFSNLCNCTCNYNYINLKGG